MQDMCDYNFNIGQENKTTGKHSNEYPEIGASISSGYVMELASVIWGNSYTKEFPDQTVDIIEAPSFLEHNDEDRKPEGDDIVISSRCETLMSCESTDVLTGNTHQVTRPGCGGVSGNVTGTHKDTGGPDSIQDTETTIHLKQDTETTVT